MLPVTVWPGRVFIHGLARIMFTSSRLLEARDPYGVQRLVVADTSAPIVTPAHPMRRPRRLADCLLVEFEEPVMARRGELWVKAPYELEVVVSGALAAAVTPVKSKYILHGELIGGKICRYYRSSVSLYEPTEVAEGEALVKIRFKLSSETRVTHIVVPIDSLDIYTHSVSGRVYYSVVEVQGNNVIQVFRATSEKPRQGLRRVKKASSIRSRSIASRGDLTWHPLTPV